MPDDLSIRNDLLLSVQRALLGEVPSALRSVTCDWEGSVIKLRFLFDGEISEDDRQSANCVGGEVIGDFLPPWTIAEEIERLDYPADQRSRALPIWAYARREDPL